MLLYINTCSILALSFIHVSLLVCEIMYFSDVAMGCSVICDCSISWLSLVLMNLSLVHTKLYIIYLKTGYYKITLDRYRLNIMYMPITSNSRGTKVGIKRYTAEYDMAAKII